MNFLFGLATGVASASAFWIICWLIPEKVWALLPEEVIEWKSTTVRGVGALILVVVAWNSLMTYGPRIELDVPTTQYYPERTQVNETTDMFGSKDRNTVFSDRIEKEPKP